MKIKRINRYITFNGFFKRHGYTFVLIIICFVTALSSIFSNLYVHYYNDSIDTLSARLLSTQEKIETLSQENIKLSDMQKTATLENVNLLNEVQSNNQKIEKYIDKINELNSEISKRTTWTLPKVSVGVCASHSYFKTYMDYRKITNKSSKQYQLLHNGSFKYDDDGLIRTKGGEFIAVALGSYYGDIGTKYVCTLQSGNTTNEVKLIKVEEKSNMHTTNGCQASNNDIIEFVIDIDKARISYPTAIRLGDFNYSKFNGYVKKMEKVTD